jgi:arginyl-tRNA--protein-N-Asp/Glu arginylyltransferase
VVRYAHTMQTPVRMPGVPAEWLVWDEPSLCPYLPGETARLPLRLPARRLTRAELAERLAGGDRRQGLLLYRPSCPACRACEAMRVDVAAFTPGRTHRRVQRRGDRLIETSIGAPTTSPEKVALYNKHKVERGLLIGDEAIDVDGYEQFLVESCTDTFEITYRREGRLIGVAVTDRAADALSAVYCFFDPADAALSIGTYSILTQIALCRRWALRYLYLGLAVSGCAPMQYKLRYVPHERLIDGVWRRFTTAA